MKKDLIWRFTSLVILSCSLCSHTRLQAADEPKYLLPKQSTQQPQNPPAKRSTYDSLTEERGTLKWIKDQQEKAQKEEEAAKKAAEPAVTEPETPEGPVINFNNVSITEVLKYASRLTGKNFVYDPVELQFTITMISDSPTSVEEVLAMILQSLRIHGFSVMEEGDSIVVHTNPGVRNAGGVYDKQKGVAGPQIATQVFVLQNADADRTAAIIKTMVSDGAIVESLGDSKIIVSDVAENIRRISDVIKQLDTQSSGLEIGQYVAVNASPSALVSLCERILEPLSANKPLVLVPHPASNSVFIVSTPYLIERSLTVMQTIDLNEAKNGFISSDEYKFDKAAAEKARKQREEEIKQQKEVEKSIETFTPDELRAKLVQQGFRQEQIEGLTLDAARETLQRSIRQKVSESELPLGTVEATQFLIQKLQYRDSNDVAKALRAIADSLMSGGQTGPTPGGMQKNLDLSQSDLIVTLNTLQPIEANNAIVFSGTKSSLKKIQELIAQIDLPVRQVFIEALILDTTLQNSLIFGVEWDAAIQRTNFGAIVGFRDPNNPAFASNFNAVQQFTPAQIAPPSTGGGLSAGSLGRKIKFRGRGFRSTGELVHALRNDSETHIIMNPKITVEHNVPAEIFVGSQIPIKGESIANASIGSTSSVVATNYVMQEIGISLKVTPLISSYKTVTLIIEQKLSSASATQVAQQGQTTAPPATVNEERTITRVHLPTDHFLVMSGAIQDQTILTDSRTPCLGGIPLIGALFGVTEKDYNKRNLMVFIRPIIIDTEEDIDEVTRHQEEILKAKSTIEKGWNRQCDDAKTLLNIGY